MCHCLLEQFVVNHAIDEWSRFLLASVDAEGGHFEHATLKITMSKWQRCICDYWR